MNWRDAFLVQAKHDYGVFKYLNERHENISDQLHYLQMASEKLARGFLASPIGDAPPPLTHAGLVRMLQHLKGNPPIRRRLGYENVQAFRAYIDSMLNLAGQIQALAPAIAGMMQPNPEYPWMDRRTQSVVVPCKFDFYELTRNVQLAKFLKLLARLLVVLDM